MTAPREEIISVASRDDRLFGIVRADADTAEGGQILLENTQIGRVVIDHQHSFALEHLRGVIFFRLQMCIDLEPDLDPKCRAR